jgi:ankyrin repeat protein
VSTDVSNFGVVLGPHEAESSDPAERRNQLDNSLRIAIDKGDETEIILLLEKGADLIGIMDNNQTSLMKASEDGNVEMVKLLLDKGADVNAATNMGCTARMVASAS